ncbi:hypothetical protein FIBSPDRAFT_1048319 [Athelia psychrophila]|uniref:Uncharacterized protein n=1 Tax=Athelia psychrophila TaxID=1759441 RepID=A0A166DZW4_9AGAM|nr:hypothetical protein FIBSPDRAFT_1048319 [Fibularhizoctonia sp. CBS 109695]
MSYRYVNTPGDGFCSIKAPKRNRGESPRSVASPYSRSPNPICSGSTSLNILLPYCKSQALTALKMAWTSKQIESFPSQKLQHRLLAQSNAGQLDPGKRTSTWYQKNIQDWKELVVPYTPSESDIASLNRCLPPDNIALLVISLIAHTTLDVEISHPSVISHIKGLVVIWPTIWIWIRLLHTKVVNARHQISLLSKEQLKIEQTRYTVLVQALLFFLGYHKPERGRPTQSTSNQLCALVTKTNGVLQMISTLWIEEEKEWRANMGFPSCNIYSESISYARSEIEQLVIAGCGGSAEEVANIAFRRVAHNLRWLRQQAAESWLGPDIANRYSQLAEDAAYVKMHMEEPSSVLCDAFRAHTGEQQKYLGTEEEPTIYVAKQPGELMVLELLWKAEEGEISWTSIFVDSQASLK